jgi:hypothetical protein
MHKKARVLSMLPALTLGALLAGAPSFVRADVPPIDVEACDGLEPGDACTIELLFDQPDESGTCMASTCERRNFRDPDASVTQYDCVLCVPKDQTTEEPTPDPVGKTDAGTDKPDEPNKATGDDPSKTSKVDTDDGAAKDSSGCSVAAAGIARGVGPWLLAAGFALVVSRRRKS